MAFTAEDLKDLKEEILKEGGIISQINSLSTASEEERNNKIVPLIGSILGLILTFIGTVMG